MLVVVCVCVCMHITFLWSKVDPAHVWPFLHSGLLRNSAPERPLTGKTHWLSASSMCYMKETTTKDQFIQEPGHPVATSFPPQHPPEQGPGLLFLTSKEWGHGGKRNSFDHFQNRPALQRPKVLSLSKHLLLLMPTPKGNSSELFFFPLDLSFLSCVGRFCVFLGTRVLCRHSGEKESGIWEERAQSVSLGS